jgi:hypothetical protein
VPGVVVVSVYRPRFADGLATLLASVAPYDADVRLWALSEPVDALRRSTVGSGAGGKFDLVNAALAARPVPPDAVVLVVDDDVRIGRGSLATLLDVGAESGFGLWQPAHARRGSHGAHPLTFERRWSRARRTTFVEIGPVFAVSSAAREVVLPFADGLGMGWGLELDWWRLAREGALELGVVDEVTVVHAEAPGETYSERQDAEWARLNARLAEAGLSHITEAQQTLATWRPWRREPPWPPQPQG